MKTIGEEGDEDVGFDALLVVMEDGTNRQVAFEVFERLFHRHELNVVLPEFGGIIVGQIGPQQITALAAPDLSELVAIERVGQRPGVLSSTSVFDQTPGGGRLGARRAELHQPFLARYLHRRELLQTRPQPFQLSPPHRALFADAIGALGEDIEVVVLLAEA